MAESLWSDAQLRTFLSSIRAGGIFGSDVDETERAEFLRQATVRVVPDVQRRMLAEVGATVDTQGVAIVAFEVLEEARWSKRATWMMVSSDPWGFLVDLVVRELRGAYRSTVRRRGDDKQLAGIASASSRAELEAGPGEDCDARSRAAQPRVPTQPSAGATCFAKDSTTRRLNSTPSWLGIVSMSVSALRIAASVQQLLDEHVGLGGVRLAEGRAHAVDHADLVAVLAAAEVHVVLGGRDREDRAAHRDARLARVTGLAPGGAEGIDLLGLQHVERPPVGRGEQRRRHEVDADAARPLGRVAVAGAPPDARAQAGGVRLDALHSRAAAPNGTRRSRSARPSPSIARRNRSKCSRAMSAPRGSSDPV